MWVEIVKYGLVLAYVALVYWLSWVGMRRTADVRGFVIGNKDMSPYVVGITLAASIASTSTFVINPGFVYVHGLSAYVHYGVAGSLGVLAAFLVLSRGFLRLGEQSQALTIPAWIYHRYQSRGFSLFFALLNLLSITFVVLILVGCSYLVAGLFPVGQKTALVLVVLFVFSYVLLGGTYAHAYTNTLQGLMMLCVTAFLLLHGLPNFDGGFFAALKQVGPNYAALYNPESDLYYSFFSVFVSGFVVTFALMLQPHILTKVLYLRSEHDLGKFIATTVLVGAFFALMLMVGFFARLQGYEIAQQDAVVMRYLAFSLNDGALEQVLHIFILLALLAAGMSTLDGILVSLSAMVVNDIAKPMLGARHSGLAWSRWVLAGLGLVGLVLAWNPPELVGLFAQKGVYGLAAASLVPILFGVLFKATPLWLAVTCAATGLLVHFYLHLFAGVTNPAVAATWAIFAALGIACIGMLVRSVGGGKK